MNLKLFIFSTTNTSKINIQIIDIPTMNTLRNCINCKNCIVINHEEHCKLFKTITTAHDKPKVHLLEASVARFPDFDLCGVNGKYYQDKVDKLKNNILPFIRHK